MNCDNTNTLLSTNKRNKKPNTLYKNYNVSINNIEAKLSTANSPV